LTQQNQRRREFLQSQDTSKEVKLQKVMQAGVAFHHFLGFEEESLIYETSGFKAEFLAAQKVRIVMDMVYGVRL
jgi:hypothetical protein